MRFFLIVILNFLLMPGAFANPQAPTLPKSPYVLPQAVRAWQAEGRQFTFIDVRAAEEYSAGHIPGAINIPYDEIERRATEIDNNKPQVVYCIYSAWRAPYAANVLADLGYSNVYTLEGGVSAWNAGGQVAYGESSTLKAQKERLEGKDKIEIAPYPKNLPKILNHPPDSEHKERIYLTKEELAFYDGMGGRPAYVAVEGVVYDVTQSRLWRGGQHDPSRGKASAGCDLTEVLKLAPHGKEHLGKFPVVGWVRE